MVGKWFGFEREEVFEEGLSNFEIGQYEEASKAFEACLAEDATDPRFKAHLLKCYEMMAGSAMVESDYGSAAAMVENAILLSPLRVDLHLLAARAFKGLHRFALARFHINRAIKVRTQSEPNL